MSGLSYLHPHVCQAARKSGLDKLVLDLLADDPCPKEIKHGPLRLASKALHGKFLDLLKKGSFDRSVLSSAQLIFDCGKGEQYDYTCPVASELVTSSGKTFKHQRL